MENNAKVAPEATKEKVSSKAKAQEIVVPRKVTKNKTYKLKGKFKNSPWFRLQSGDQPDNGSRLLYYDKVSKGYKSIQYAINYPSPFVDEQRDAGYDIVSEQILFESGWLAVDEKNQNLQVFMDHHPWNVANGGKIFYEHDPTVIAIEEMNELKTEAQAMKAAFDMDINIASALLRPDFGAEVHEMKTDIISREVLRLAKRNPGKFLESIQEPELLTIKYLAYTSVDLGICTLTDGRQVYRWADNGQKLLSIPFGEDTFSYIANWFTTDDGLEVMSKISAKLKK